MTVGFRIYLIGDGEDERGLDAALAALPAGEAAFQLRAPGLEGRALYERAERLRGLTRARGAPLFVNDRVDVALAVAADGVHLPGRGIGPEAARRIAGGMRIGVSTHSLAEARAAAEAGADLITFGPVWPTASHPGAAGVGVAALAAVASAIACRVFALGGVDAARARQLPPGVGAACLRGVLAAPDPAAAATSLASALRS